MSTPVYSFDKDDFSTENITLATPQGIQGGTYLSKGKRMKIESDTPHICSGVRLGKTLGSPIGILIKNKDWENWQKKMSVKEITDKIKKITVPRPGHADLAGVLKYDFDDIRNVIERSSARETAMRVAIGAICRKFINILGVEVASRVVQIHDVYDDSTWPSNCDINSVNKKIDSNPVRCLSETISKKMIDQIKKAQKKGESVIFHVHVVVDNLV